MSTNNGIKWGLVIGGAYSVLQAFTYSEFRLGYLIGGVIVVAIAAYMHFRRA